MNKLQQVLRPRLMLSTTKVHPLRLLRASSFRSKARKHRQEASLTMKTKRLSSFSAKGSASSPETNLEQRRVKKKKATAQVKTLRKRRVTQLKQAK